MADTDVKPEDEAKEQETPEEPDEQQKDEDEEPDYKAEVLKIKEALRKERKARRDAEQKANAKPEGDPEKEREQLRAEVMKEANGRILRSEIKAVAAGMLSNPELAPRLLDLDEFEVDAEGNVPVDDIKSALEDVLKQNPGLGIEKRKAKSGPDFKGGGKPDKPDMNELLRVAMTGR